MRGWRSLSNPSAIAAIGGYTAENLQLPFAALYFFAFRFSDTFHFGAKKRWCSFRRTMSFLRNICGPVSRRIVIMSQTRLCSGQMGDLGSGAGKGGGGGGSIRDAGGAFGRMEAAHEGEYFYKKQKEQLLKLKEDLHGEISFHEEQIKRHKAAIDRHKERIDKLEHNPTDGSHSD